MLARMVAVEVEALHPVGMAAAVVARADGGQVRMAVKMAAAMAAAGAAMAVGRAGRVAAARMVGGGTYRHRL